MSPNQHQELPCPLRAVVFGLTGRITRPNTFFARPFRWVYISQLGSPGRHIRPNRNPKPDISATRTEAERACMQNDGCFVPRHGRSKLNGLVGLAVDRTGQVAISKLNTRERCLACLECSCWMGVPRTCRVAPVGRLPYPVVRIATE